MKQQLLFFGRYAIVWLLFFVVTKAVFLLYNLEHTNSLSAYEIAKIFLYGFRMDISATGYMLLIPGLILVFIPFISKYVFFTLNKLFFIVISLFVGFITIVDCELYKHWGFRLDLTPLNYIGNDAMSSILWSKVLLLISYWLVICGLFYLGFNRFVLNKFKFSNGKWFHSPIYLLITAALILPIRGSLDIGPMNAGFVYFHKEKPFANHAALNVFWNVGNAVDKANNEDRYPENFVDSKIAKRDFNLLYNQTNKIDSLDILKSQKPNILIVILEGFTAKIIGALGGDSTITPNFNNLVKEGILFENYYASGDRTDKGLISILSGYPAQTKTSIITYTGKSEKLPNLTLDLKKQGYHTSFLYGGDVNFANMNSYLNICGFSQVIKKSHFNINQGTSKWGVHDHITFDTLYNHLSRQNLPFFNTMLSLSSHEPFEVPMESFFIGEDDETKFLNSAYYTDFSLGNFINKAKKSPWWENTLVILLADHGNRHPGNSPNYPPERFHIPMLWLGGALNVKDTIVKSYGSQTDLPATILSRLNINTEKYIYSKDILRVKNNDFAYYVYNNGFGFVSDSNEVVYDLDGKQLIHAKGDSNKLSIGKSYMQMIYSDFNNL